MTVALYTYLPYDDDICVPVNAFMSVVFARGSHFNKSARKLADASDFLHLLVSGILLVNFATNLFVTFSYFKKRRASSMCLFLKCANSS